MVTPEGRVALERMGSDRFYANVPRFALFPLQFGRDSSGAVTEVVYGGELFINARARGPVQFDYPREWVRYLGHYRAAIPWSNNFRVVIRKGVLLYVAPEGTEEVLVPERAPGALPDRPGSRVAGAAPVRYGDFGEGAAGSAVGGGVLQEFCAVTVRVVIPT